MARKKRLNIETAEQADGALEATRSAYDIAGIRDVRYRETTFAAYREKLAGMDLIELHDHAYDLAVVPSASRPETIKRLEDKYLSVNPEQRIAYGKERQAAAARAEDETVAQRAERILSGAQ